MKKLLHKFLYNTFLESSFDGEGEYKDVELFRTDEKPHKTASGVSLMQLELFIQEWEVLMTHVPSLALV